MIKSHVGLILILNLIGSMTKLHVGLILMLNLIGSMTKSYVSLILIQKLIGLVIPNSNYCYSNNYNCYYRISSPILPP